MKKAIRKRSSFSVAKGFRKAQIARWAGQHLDTGTDVVCDGLKCFDAVTEAGCAHEVVVTGGGRAAVEKAQFDWVNTVVGDLKTALRSSDHAFNAKYALRATWPNSSIASIAGTASSRLDVWITVSFNEITLRLIGGRRKFQADLADELTKINCWLRENIIVAL